MSDLMRKDNRVKIFWGTSSIVGGLGIWGLMGLLHNPIAAVVVGAVIFCVSWRLFQKPSSAMAGMVGMLAGVLVAVSPVVGVLASFLLGASGLGLLAGGIWTLYKVFRSRRV
ncbi:MAG: hypothetical protein HKM06_06515 [Spirochaetales bacterium]|nr:hypothetical protein [Spirochaetales bacterium]